MPEPKHPLKVFLCHASTDKPKVRELYRYLRKRGIQPWFDEEDLVGGQDWQVEIPKALATSDAIIICLTKNSVDKEGYVQNEIKFALDKALGMPEGRIFLIPVKFEGCEVPFSLSRYQWVDLTIESGYSKMMKALKFRASQLERTTVELPKRAIEEENLAIEKATKEKVEREAIEKATREKAEKESAEKARLEAEELAKQKAAKEKWEREAAEKTAREKAEKEAVEKARLKAEELAKEKIAKEKASREFAEKVTRERAKREVVEKPVRSLLIIISSIILVAMCLFLCVFAVFPVVTKSDISSKPVLPGISDIRVPFFSAGEDIYVYFNLDRTPSSQKFESRWFHKVNILWTDLYIPIGYLEYTPVNIDTRLFFHLKNPGIVGEYRVDIYMDQDLVGTKTFEIYPK